MDVKATQKGKIQFRPCRFSFVSKNSDASRGTRGQIWETTTLYIIYVTKKHHPLFTGECASDRANREANLHTQSKWRGASCLTARENESAGKREGGRALVSKGGWTRRVIILFQKQTTHTLRCTSSSPSYIALLYPQGGGRKGVARVSVRWAFESIYTQGPGGSGCEEREREKRDNKDEKVEERRQNNTTHRCQKHNFPEESGTPFHQCKNLTSHTHI